MNDFVTTRRPTPGAWSELTTLPNLPAPVEIWCASLRRWVQGFHVVETGRDGHIVRRSSDGSLLPVAFTDHEVRSLQ